MIIDQYTVHCHHDHRQVPNNGFNPTWSEEASFNIRVPELAIIEFKVLDIIEPRLWLEKKFQLKSQGKTVGSAENHLGSFFIAFPLIRKGYRNITLQVQTDNNDGDRSDKIAKAGQHRQS